MQNIIQALCHSRQQATKSHLEQEMPIFEYNTYSLSEKIGEFYEEIFPQLWNLGHSN